MRLACLGLGLLVGMAVSGAMAQQGGQPAFPTRAVTIVVPFPPGGSADAVPRITAEKLRETWGQPVVIR